MPTRTAKTFHPRTLGHLAYVQAIQKVMQEDTGTSEQHPNSADGGGSGRKS
jgi:hypothetical protein